MMCHQGRGTNANGMGLFRENLELWLGCPQVHGDQPISSGLCDFRPDHDLA